MNIYKVKSNYVPLFPYNYYTSIIVFARDEAAAKNIHPEDRGGKYLMATSEWIMDRHDNDWMPYLQRDQLEVDLLGIAV